MMTPEQRAVNLAWLDAVRRVDAVDEAEAPEVETVTLTRIPKRARVARRPKATAAPVPTPAVLEDFDELVAEVTPSDEGSTQRETWKAQAKSPR